MDDAVGVSHNRPAAVEPYDQASYPGPVDITTLNPVGRVPQGTPMIANERPFEPTTSHIEDREVDPLLRISAKEEDNLHVVLAMNEAYSELIDGMIEKAEEALRDNQDKQKTLETRKKVFNTNAAMIKRKIPVNMFMPPYFKDQFNMCPPQNEEMKRKMECMIYDPLLKEERKWTASELKTLHLAVRNFMIEKRLTHIYGQRELVQEKIREACATTTLEERVEWNDRLDAFNRQIDYTRTLSDNIILIGDYAEVDWATIAMVHFKGQRTPASLRLKWCNEQSPEWNKAEWTASEVKKLNELASERFVSWTMIADQLGTRRTPWQCFEKYKSEISSEILKREWTHEEDERLVKLVESLQLNGVIQWDKVTYHMAGRTRQQCRTRYLRTLDKSIKHGRWTDEEDLLLMCSIGRYGAKDWRKIAKGVPGRNDGQCRERWVNVLDRANRSEEWTMEEDEKLLYAVNMFGKGQWAKISSVLPGRNQRVCKARFRSLLTTKMRICAAQLSKIREAQASRKPMRTKFSNRSDNTFKEFNQLTGGNDETGENFCNQARSVAHADKFRYKIPEPEVRRVVEEGMQDISKKYEGEMEDEDHTEELFNGIEQGTGGGAARRKEEAWLPVEFDPEMTEEMKCQRLTEALCQVVAKQDQFRSGAAQEAYGCKARAQVEVKMKRMLEDAVDSRVRSVMRSAVDEDEDRPMSSREAAAIDRRKALEARVRRQMESAADSAANDMMHPTAATTHAAELLMAELPRIASIATPLLSSFWQGDKLHSMDEVMANMEDTLKHHKEFIELRELLRCLLVEPLTLIYSLEDDNRKKEFLTEEFNRAREQLMGDVEMGRVIKEEKRAPEKMAKMENKEKTHKAKTPAVRGRGRPSKGLKETRGTAVQQKVPPLPAGTEASPPQGDSSRGWDGVDAEEIPVDWIEKEQEEGGEEEQTVAKTPSRSSSRAKKTPKSTKKTPACVTNKRKAPETEGEEEEEEGDKKKKEKETPAKRGRGRKKMTKSNEGEKEMEKDRVDGEEGDDMEKSLTVKRSDDAIGDAMEGEEEDTVAAAKKDTVEGPKETVESQDKDDGPSVSGHKDDVEATVPGKDKVADAVGTAKHSVEHTVGELQQ